MAQWPWSAVRELGPGGPYKVGMCPFRDTPKLSDEELDSALVALPAWRAAEDRKSITRSFVAKNFVKGAWPVCGTQMLDLYQACPSKSLACRAHHAQLLSAQHIIPVESTI